MRWTRLCHGRSRVLRCPADFDVGSDRGERSGWCDDSTFQIININSLSTAAPARSPRANSPSRMIAGRSSTPTGSAVASKAMSSRVRAARCRKRAPSTAPGSPAPTGSATRSRHHRGARERRHRAAQPPRTAARRRRGELDPPGRRGAGQRRLRRDRRAPAPRPADPAAAQAGAGVRVSRARNQQRFLDAECRLVIATPLDGEGFEYEMYDKIKLQGMGVCQSR